MLGYFTLSDRTTPLRYRRPDCHGAESLWKRSKVVEDIYESLLRRGSVQEPSILVDFHYHVLVRTRAHCIGHLAFDTMFRRWIRKI